MAFTTEFVMGAGGGEYDSLNFYWESSGGNTSSPQVTVVATVDAGENALVRVSGVLTQGQTWAGQIPQVQIGDTLFEPTPAEMLRGLTAVASGPTEIRCLSRTSSKSTLVGFASVVRYTPPARYVASGGGEGPVILPNGEWHTLSQHTVSGYGEGLASFEVVRQNGFTSAQARLRVNDTLLAQHNAAASPLIGEGTAVVKPGDVITLEAFVTSTNQSYRQINSWSWSLS